ncbi:MAG: aspartate-semialdehyde dehydrogenase [Halobacteriaceae archaeon]
MSVKVGILGATGAVGQRFIQLLTDNSDFTISAVTASPESEGLTYQNACDWRLDVPMPEAIAELEVRATEPTAVPDDIDLLFSSLPSDVADDIEPTFADAGYMVCSNSSNERLSPDVPLIIPEINPDHLDLLSIQQKTRNWEGALIKNPNCSTITMVPPLAALQQFGIKNVHVATLQAVSGAGYTGVSSMEIIDNVIPHIGGEEKKMETEPQKILGTLSSEAVEPASLSISASCNRVPTIDGHLENVWVETEEGLSPADVKDAFNELDQIDLPSAPESLISIREDPARPQPRLDRMENAGMSIVVGGIESTEEGILFNCLAHNTIRGAAGASVLNGELLHQNGYLS